MVILGIETSCDETAVSVVEAEGNLNSLHFEVLGSSVNSQVKLHSEYGGVVPNLAKREHQKNLPLVLKQALKEAFSKALSSKLQALSFIDLIAVTVGPGLEPALWTGIKFAEELGKSWGKAVIPANHMEGHIASVLINRSDKFSISNSQFSNKKVEFPILALLISGGHTELIYLKSWVEKEKIGETQDDAVGEAFDKVARMLNLPYPGGPEISKLAEEARKKDLYLDTKFPRPMIHSDNLDFSFSGLKTAILYYLKNQEKNKNSFSAPTSDSTDISLLRNSCVARPQSTSQGNQKQVHSTNFSEEIKLKVAREFEDAVIETLISKTKKALDKYLPKTLIIGGGVIANKALRENFLKLKETYPDIEILIPEKSLTTDNATMIAAAGFIEYLRNQNSNRELKADGNLNIS